MRADGYIVMRRGIRYEIELREGIDLAVFALGRFQRHVSTNRRLVLPRDALVIDVG